MGTGLAEVKTFHAFRYNSFLETILWTETELFHLQKEEEIK